MADKILMAYEKYEKYKKFINSDMERFGWTNVIQEWIAVFSSF